MAATTTSRFVSPSRTLLAISSSFSTVVGSSNGMSSNRSWCCSACQVPHHRAHTDSPAFRNRTVCSAWQTRTPGFRFGRGERDAADKADGLGL